MTFFAPPLLNNGVEIVPPSAYGSAGMIWHDDGAGNGSFEWTHELQGYAVKNVAPTDGQLLVWNNPNSDWEPQSLSGDATLSRTGVISFAAVNPNVGTWNNLTVNAKGLVTGGSNTSYQGLLTLTTLGSSGSATLIGNTLNIPQYAYSFSTGLTNSAGTITVNTSQNITTLSNLTSAGFVKTNASGLLSVDSNTYLTANQTITLSGDVSGTGTTAITATLATVNGNTGSFGSTTAVPVITVNGKGLITAVSTATLGTMAVQNANSVAITGGTITGLSAATNPSDVTILSQVQSLIATGVHTYLEVNAYFSSNVTIASPGALTDGSFTVTSATGSNRILLTGQSTGSQNGPWVYNGSAVPLTRPLDYATASSQSAGLVYFVNGVGSAKNSWSFILNTANVTVDTTSTSWGTFSAAISGSGMITVSGGVVSVSAGSISSSYLANTTVSANSYGSSTAIPSFTVNAQGQITAASTNAVIAPAGTLSGTTLNATVTTSSLTSVGTIGTGTWQGTAISPTYITTGTSGANIPLLNGTLTFSGADTFSSTLGIGGAVGAYDQLTVTTTLSHAVGLAGTMVSVDGNTHQHGLNSIGTYNPTSGAVKISAVEANATVIAPTGQTITNAAGLSSTMIWSSNVGTITNAYGLYIEAGTAGAGTITTAYGAYIAAPTCGSTNYALWAANATIGGQLTVASGTITTSQPATITQTWNAAGTVFQGLLVNITPTASNTGSVLVALQNSGTNKFTVDKNGLTVAGSAGFSNIQGFVTEGGLSVGAGSISAGVAGNQINVYASSLNVASLNTNGCQLASAGMFEISSTTSVTSPDCYLGRSGAANWRFGNVDAATAVAQKLSVQSIVAGTSNVSGANWTLIGSLSTGSGTSGDIIFQTGGTGAGATSQNTATTALTIKGGTQNVIAAGTIAASNLSLGGTFTTSGAYTTTITVTGTTTVTLPTSGTLLTSASAAVTSAVAITGGTIDGTTIGGTTPCAANTYAQINAQVGTTYTLVLGDNGKRVTISNASAITLTVPPNSSVAFPTGASVLITQLGAGKVSWTPGAGVTINVASGTGTAAQYNSFVLTKYATDTWLVEGQVA